MHGVFNDNILYTRLISIESQPQKIDVVVVVVIIIVVVVHVVVIAVVDSEVDL